MLRFFLYSALIIVGLPLILGIAFLVVFGAINLYDPALDPRIAQLEAQYPLPKDSENGFYALKGLEAPDGEDLVSYGKKIDEDRTPFVDPMEEWITPSPLTTDAQNNVSEKALLQESESGLTPFEEDAIRLRCVRTDVFSSYGDDKPPLPCAAGEEVSAILEKYRSLLSRYKSLSSYPHYADSPTGLNTNPGKTSYGPITDLQKLAVTYMIFKSRTGHADESIRFWIENTKFLNNILSGQSFMVTQAIDFIGLTQNLNLLAIMLNENPGLAKQYGPQLLPLLSQPAFGEGGIDLDKVFLAEKRILNSQQPGTQSEIDTRRMDAILYNFLYKRNHTANRLFVFYQELKEAVQTPKPSPSSAIAVKHDQILGGSIKALLYNPFGNAMVRSLFKGEVFYQESYWPLVAQKRLLGAYLQALSDDTAPENIPSFLSTLPAEWKNPIKDEPFLWDPETSEIYFEKETVEKQFYDPLFRKDEKGNMVDENGDVIPSEKRVITRIGVPYKKITSPSP